MRDAPVMRSIFPVANQASCRRQGISLLVRENEQPVRCKTFDTIFNSTEITDYNPNLSFDFISIDIEGMDYDVISSYDFPVGFRPIIILIEDKPPVGESTDSLLIQNFLTSIRYKLVARTVVTAVYIDEDSTLIV